MIGGSEVEVRLQCLSHFLMFRKLLAVVEGEGVALILVRCQQACNDAGYAVGMLAADMSCQHITRLAFGQRNETPLVIFTNHGIATTFVSFGLRLFGMPTALTLIATELP